MKAETGVVHPYAISSVRDQIPGPSRPAHGASCGVAQEQRLQRRIQELRVPSRVLRRQNRVPRLVSGI